MVKTCNGHNPAKIASTLEDWVKNRSDLGAPQVLIANTVKGYGLICMENIPKFHFRLPTRGEMEMGNRYDD